MKYGQMENENMEMGGGMEYERMGMKNCSIGMSLLCDDKCMYGRM